MFFGILFICVLVLFSFKYLSNKKKKLGLNYLQIVSILIFPIIFLIEWFLNHPAMRYGGYVLVGFPFFIITSLMLHKYVIKVENLKKLTIFFVIISLSLFVGRNVSRLSKEIKFYNYNVYQSPYFYVENIESEIIFNENDFKVYSTKNEKMCWAVKTPCSYFKTIRTDKFLGLNVVYRVNE